MSIPKRVAERLQSNLRRFVPVLNAQKARDVSEADTVTLVKDVLSDVFGYDKYAELTGEHAIRGTYCDLAIKIDGKLQLLIEVKAIGLDLRDSHVKQAVDYAANQGAEWVVLTNGIRWTLYHVVFKQPIDKVEVCSIDLTQINPRAEGDLEHLFVFCREGLTKNALAEFRDRKDATSRYMLAAIVLNADSVLSAIRREVRRVSDILVDEEVIAKMLRDEVIKREAIEGEEAEAARRRFNRNSDKSIKASSKSVKSDKTPDDRSINDSTSDTPSMPA